MNRIMQRCHITAWLNNSGAHATRGTARDGQSVSDSFAYNNRSEQPCHCLITWAPTQTTATRPLAIQINGTWFTYGWDLTKNICEVYGQHGYIRTAYTYTPYGSVTMSGDLIQPIQWSSEYHDTELALVCYNYRHYNPTDGRWLGRDRITFTISENTYNYATNNSLHLFDILGLANHPISLNTTSRIAGYYITPKTVPLRFVKNRIPIWNIDSTRDNGFACAQVVIFEEEIDVICKKVKKTYCPEKVDVKIHIVVFVNNLIVVNYYTDTLSKTRMNSAYGHEVVPTSDLKKVAPLSWVKSKEQDHVKDFKRWADKLPETITVIKTNYDYYQSESNCEKEFKEKIKKELENSYYAALRETKAKYDEGENPPHYYRGIYPTEVE